MSGCRYIRAIKQAINKTCDNTSSINLILAELIAEYSHQTYIRPGSIMLGHSEYFIIKRVHSPHWVTGFFCPPKILLVRGDEVVTRPRLHMRSRLFKKKVFHPFKKPVVRLRLKTFDLTNEQMQNRPRIL